MSGALDKPLDLIIIGAGPAGISAAFEAQKHGLSNLVVERGLLANTIYQYPIGLTVFSTPDELEFEPGPLSAEGGKPTRERLLSYYVRFVREKRLQISTEDSVTGVSRQDGLFKVVSTRGERLSKNVIFAIGAMDKPRRLGIPGEDLPKVHHLFRETYPWVGRKVLVVGGGNSAGEAALFLSMEGVDTTLAIFRDDWENVDPKQGCIKYWVKEPLELEREQGCLTVFFLKSIEAITESSVLLIDESGREVVLENDAVFVLIGSDADFGILESLGLGFKESKYGRVPIYDPESFETEIQGLYTIGHFTEQRHISGAIAAGRVAVSHIAETILESKA